MQRLLVMTVIGQDRPGLVESVAALVAEHGGNWLESRMSRLGGQFAGILRVEVPGENEPALVAALKKLESRGLTVVVHPDQPKPLPASARQSVLDIVGQDRPGIVREISHALASFGVNVEELADRMRQRRHVGRNPVQGPRPAKHSRVVRRGPGPAAAGEDCRRPDRRNLPGRAARAPRPGEASRLCPDACMLSQAAVCFR